ncbi:hypothetical protein HQ590_11605 [bacterium]|nr:hypothetical protein [bacterium]
MNQTRANFPVPGWLTLVGVGLLAGLLWPALVCADDGVFCRFKVIEPAEGTYYVDIRGFVHVPPWRVPSVILPAEANKDRTKRFVAGQFTPWHDYKAQAGKLLHGRHDRSGGVAEFPNAFAYFHFDKNEPNARKVVIIELATAPDEKAVVKRFEEPLQEDLTTFLVSPTLAKDKDSLESLSQMENRQLAWARAATGGKRVSPKSHIIETTYYGPWIAGTASSSQVLSLLGFNYVGNQSAEVHAKFPELGMPGFTHSFDIATGTSRETIDELMKRQAPGYKEVTQPGAPFNFADEVCCYPNIGTNKTAIANFRAWLAERKILPQDLGVAALDQVVPIEDPKVFAEREAQNGPAARRVYYYTARFRQEASTQRIKWMSESFHRYFPPGLVTSTLVADHPYFGGTGLGMGLRTGNTTWGWNALALDWFDLARQRAVDMAGIEDWMGLQYMFGPKFTWEGFQLMGFQAAIFRSGSGGTLPICSWITPSDETNLLLKSTSALAQGSKHFFYWAFGPTAFGSENYWSDLRSEYDGIARFVRQLAAAEHITGPGTVRKTKVALLYSISSDLWQPFGYIHMLERRGVYLSLIHDQYLVDMLTEQDIEAGRLKGYDVLLATDPCITAQATAAIGKWVRAGGYLLGTCAAGSRNEFNEEVTGLSQVFGISPKLTTDVQPGEYRVRGSLNGLDYLDRISLDTNEFTGPAATCGVLGVKVRFEPAKAKVVGRFADGSPAAAVNSLGWAGGRTLYLGACPGLTYIKDAHFVPRELKEKWPATPRRMINGLVAARAAPRLVELSHPVVEAGIYDAPAGTALVLANFTYQPIDALHVRVPLTRPVTSVRSVESGGRTLAFELRKPAKALKKQGCKYIAVFTMKLGLNDIVLLE